MAGSLVSLTELARHGAPALAHFRERTRPPSSAIEWLGIAVGRLPELSAQARTVDEIPWRPHEHARVAHRTLLEALEEELAMAAALITAALDEHLRRYPKLDGERDREQEAEAYAQMIALAHRSAPRHAEFLVAGYTAFVSAAIEASGCLADAETTAAGARRWDRGAHEHTVAQRADQVYDALVNALGGLLAHARLVAHGVAPRQRESE